MGAVTTAYLGLGANLGDRLAALRAATAALDTASDVRVVARSPVFETDPVAATPQPLYLNAALRVETTLAPRALSGDFAPGFYVKHILKDMRIALDSAAELHLDLPGLAIARKLYEQVAERGWEDCGTQALYRLYLAQ